MPKRILCTFDYGVNCMTGFATVSRNVIRELKKHFGKELLIDIIAVNYYGEPYKEYDETVTVISGKLSQDSRDETKMLKEGDPYARLVFLDYLFKHDYDAIYIIGDLGIIVHAIPYIRTIKHHKKKNNRKNFKSILYFPVDGNIHDLVYNADYDEKAEEATEHLLKVWDVPECKNYFGKEVRQIESLDYIDTVITYTEYGKREILKHNPKLISKVKVIYHGINLNDFYPLPEEDVKAFRNDMFGSNADKFIVGVINRNQYRKDIPTSIFGFIDALENWEEGIPKPFLYMHLSPTDYMGWDLRYLLQQTKLVEGEDYMFSYGDNNGQVPLEVLNCIYNSIDVHLTTATGGGWELVSTEMFACKKPCIQPNHTSLGETGADGRAYLLEEFLPIVFKDDSVIRKMCHYEEVGEKIRQAATNHYRIKTLEDYHIKNAYGWVIKLTWENVCKKWIEIFDKI